MVTNRLTSTRWRARARDPLDKLTETIAGRSCGVRPMAITRLNSSASISGRSKAMLMTKIVTVSTAATLTSNAEKSRRPTWKEVPAGRSPRPSAIPPNAVADPVATTAPRPEPCCTIVPMNAHEGRSTAESLAGAGADDFTAGCDSPVSTDSSHSRPSTAISRKSAGTTSPTPSATTSPGTSVTTFTRRAAPSRQASASYRMSRCMAVAA
jgi:hypothetical protein